MNEHQHIEEKRCPHALTIDISQAVGFRLWIQGVLIVTPFVFLLLDVLSWWLTKWYPGFAIFTLIGGVGYSMASTAMIFSCLYPGVRRECSQSMPAELASNVVAFNILIRYSSGEHWRKQIA